jgi:hypothetical protein
MLLSLLLFEGVREIKETVKIASRRSIFGSTASPVWLRICNHKTTSLISPSGTFSFYSPLCSSEGFHFCSAVPSLVLSVCQPSWLNFFKFFFISSKLISELYLALSYGLLWTVFILLRAAQFIQFDVLHSS